MKRQKPRRPPKPCPKTRAEFFARENEVWEELVAVWRGLPEEALTRPGACGPEWSVKDVMNHIAAWLQVTLRLILEIRDWRLGNLQSLIPSIRRRRCGSRCLHRLGAANEIDDDDAGHHQQRADDELPIHHLFEKDNPQN